MVWGGITYANRTLLIAISGTIPRQHSCQGMVPFINAHPQVNFQQDNAFSHTARLTRDYLNNNNVNVFP